MQIVIDIDNELYEYFSKRRTMHDNGYFSHVGKLIKALRDGTPLPKGHGRLIDADELLKQQDGGEWNGVGFSQEYVYSKTIKNATTIIEADK